MKIIIAGSGDTGTHLAKMLAFEHQDVTLMSRDRDYLSTIDSTCNLITCAGDPASPSDLRAAGVEGADLFVGVTPSGTGNMVACQIASAMGVRQTVARIDNPEYLGAEGARVFGTTGIGAMVYPESLVAADICEFMSHTWALYRREMHGGALLFCAVSVTPDSPMAGRQLKALGTGRILHISALRRGGRIIIPRGDDTLEPGDTAYITARAEHEHEIARMAGQTVDRTASIMIAGRGGTVAPLLECLEGRHVNVTLVTDDRELCRRVAARWPAVAAVHAELTDFGAMRDEGIAHCDLFIALGDDASQNIVGCLMAKNLGVRRRLAQIEDLQYINEAIGLGIDMVVNKKLITSAVILRSVLTRTTRVSAMLSFEDLEVAELEAAEGAPVTRRPVKDLGLPRTMTFGALMRGDDTVIIEGSTQIQTGDLVTVVFQPGLLSKVERIFRHKSLLGDLHVKGIN